MELPPFPDGMESVWQWALELDATRSFSQFGPLPTTYTEMRAWASMTGRDPDPEEVAALMQLDRVLCYPGEPSKDDDG